MQSSIQILLIRIGNWGLKRINNSIVDTIKIAKTGFQDKQLIQTLMRKLDVFNTRENFHGALLDATLLAKVYLRLTTENKNLNLKDNKRIITNNTKTIRI